MLVFLPKGARYASRPASGRPAILAGQATFFSSSPALLPGCASRAGPVAVIQFGRGLSEAAGIADDKMMDLRSIALHPGQGRGKAAELLCKGHQRRFSFIACNGLEAIAVQILEDRIECVHAVGACGRRTPRPRRVGRVYPSDQRRPEHSRDGRFEPAARSRQNGE